VLLVYAVLVVEEGEGETKDTGRTATDTPSDTSARWNKGTNSTQESGLSEKKLSIYTCPTGDFSYHVSQLVETGSEYATQLSARHLPGQDAWMGTRYQLFPKLIYGAAAEDAYQSIWYKLLPLLRVNRNITKEYRMLPLRFQGLALPNPNIESLSRKIHILQTNWDTGSTIGKMLHQAYQVFQVEVGLGGNIFTKSYASFQGLATHVFFRIYGSY